MLHGLIAIVVGRRPVVVCSSGESAEEGNIEEEDVLVTDEAVGLVIEMIIVVDVDELTVDVTAQSHERKISICEEICANRFTLLLII